MKDALSIAAIPVRSAALTGAVGAAVGLACGLAGGAANAYFHYGLHRVHALLLLRAMVPLALLGGGLGAASGVLAAVAVALGRSRLRWLLRAAVILAAVAVGWSWRWWLLAAVKPWDAPLAPHAPPLTTLIATLATVAAGAAILASVTRGWRRLRRVELALAVTVSLTFAGLVLAARSLDHRPAGPNVLLIVIDALRADHVGCYGYERPTTPFLDELASRGTLFEDAYAAANMTRMSVPSILTGVPPASHGGRELGDPADPWFLSIAELLQDRGWATVFLGPNPSLDPVFGNFYGFDTYFSDDFFHARFWRDLRRGGSKRAASAAHLNATLLDWLSRRRGERPFFAYVHYRDVHGPYTPPAPYDSMFAEPGRAVRPLPPDAFEASNRYLRLDDDRGDINAYIDRYDGGIRYTDGEVGALARELDSRGLLRDTLVIVTADHGEGFWEHGHANHGSTLHEEQVRVPLIVVTPARERTGSRVRALVSHLDLAPTILDLVGLPLPAQVQGRSLSPCLREPGCSLGRPAVFFETVERSGLRSGPWKFVLDATAGEQMLYHLGIDPGERSNLLAPGPLCSPESPHEIARTLALLLSDHMERATAAARDTGAVAISEELDRQLRSLGYLQ